MCLNTGYQARIEADSLSPDEVRLTTFVVTYPHCIHNELLTHRMFSRNSSSSRAIPVDRKIEAIELDPFVPLPARNQRGMQAGENLSPEESKDFLRDVSLVKRTAIELANKYKTKIHKQWINRYLDPFGWMTTIITATEYKNFFSLRCNKEAQPEIYKIASMMKDLYDSSTPKEVKMNEWHLPFINEPERSLDSEKLLKLSTARCARVSYLNHDGTHNIEKDYALHDRLLSSKHMSPFEHSAQPFESFRLVKAYQETLKSYGLYKPYMDSQQFVGNFRGWIQYRKFIPNESGV